MKMIMTLVLALSVYGVAGAHEHHGGGHHGGGHHGGHHGGGRHGGGHVRHHGNGHRWHRWHPPVVVITTPRASYGFAWTVRLADETFVVSGDGEEASLDEAWGKAFADVYRLAREGKVESGTTMRIVVSWRGEKYVRTVRITSFQEKEAKSWMIEIEAKE